MRFSNEIMLQIPQKHATHANKLLILISRVLKNYIDTLKYNTKSFAYASWFCSIYGIILTKPHSSF